MILILFSNKICYLHTRVFFFFFLKKKIPKGIVCTMYTNNMSHFQIYNTLGKKYYLILIFKMKQTFGSIGNINKSTFFFFFFFFSYEHQ